MNKIRDELILDTLRCDIAPESFVFVKVWDGLTPAERDCVGLEAIAVASDITPRRLYELFMGASMIQGREMVGLTLALTLPGAMRQTAELALTPMGHMAREHLFKAARVLPTPKGSTTNINLGKKQGELGDGDDDDEDEDGSTLEAADDFMLRASKAMGQKQLPAPVVIAETIDEEGEGDEGD
jgi:hypothetical protein